MTKKTQLEKDIAFCIDDCGMDDNQIGDMLRVCEEFIFECENPEDVERLHDENYLKIEWKL